MMKFTFKREPKATGLAAVGNPYSTVIIKLKKVQVGTIYPPSWSSNDRLWRVRVQVKGAPPDNPNTTWRWVGFKSAKFDNEALARSWVETNLEKALTDNKLELHIEP